MKTAKGLHIWVASFGSFDSDLFITTRLRAPMVAIRRALQVAKQEGYRGVFVKLEYRGTIDA